MSSNGKKAMKLLIPTIAPPAGARCRSPRCRTRRPHARSGSLRLCPEHTAVDGQRHRRQGLGRDWWSDWGGVGELGSELSRSGRGE
eukprot:249299-Rhodomonas_salina.1